MPAWLASMHASRELQDGFVGIAPSPQRELQAGFVGLGHLAKPIAQDLCGANADKHTGKPAPFCICCRTTGLS
jgi:hypothetical protein